MGQAEIQGPSVKIEMRNAREPHAVGVQRRISLHFESKSLPKFVQYYENVRPYNSLL